MQSSKIVVEKLTRNVTEAHLREIFGSYGRIESIDLPLNKQFMTNRGTAYILYDHPSGSESAIAHMHEAQLDGVVISPDLPGMVHCPPVTGHPQEDPLHQDIAAHPREEAAMVEGGEQQKMTRTSPVIRTQGLLHRPGVGDGHPHTPDPHLGHRPEDEANPVEVHHGGEDAVQVTVLGAATVIAEAEAEVGQEADLGMGEEDELAG
ncbi:RNA recognition motif aka RRM, RBD, or RNP domain-containing protein [Cladophialophora immunda]|nr:RNA recognition motif aka RRM, RBD, or RNP domain-containing protein [Cladophialophora immunda]